MTAVVRGFGNRTNDSSNTVNSATCADDDARDSCGGTGKTLYALVSFDGLNDVHDEWIEMASELVVPPLAPHLTKVHLCEESDQWRITRLLNDLVLVQADPYPLDTALDVAVDTTQNGYFSSFGTLYNKSTRPLYYPRCRPGWKRRGRDVLWLRYRGSVCAKVPSTKEEIANDRVHRSSVSLNLSFTLIAFVAYLYVILRPLGTSPSRRRYDSQIRRGMPIMLTVLTVIGGQVVANVGVVKMYDWLVAANCVAFDMFVISFGVISMM
jgi:hypothetical protein